MQEVEVDESWEFLTEDEMRELDWPERLAQRRGFPGIPISLMEKIDLLPN